MVSSPQSCDSYMHLLHIPRSSFRLACLRRFLLSGPPGIATSLFWLAVLLAKRTSTLLQKESIALPPAHYNGKSHKFTGYLYKRYGNATNADPFRRSEKSLAEFRVRRRESYGIRVLPRHVRGRTHFARSVWKQPKRRQRRMKRGCFEEAARLAARIAPGIVSPRR